MTNHDIDHHARLSLLARKGRLIQIRTGKPPSDRVLAEVTGLDQQDVRATRERAMEDDAWPFEVMVPARRGEVRRWSGREKKVRGAGSASTSIPTLPSSDPVAFFAIPPSAAVVAWAMWRAEDHPEWD